MKKTLQILVVVAIIIVLLLSSIPLTPISDAATVVKAYAEDTIAGMDSTFSVPKLKPNETVYLEVVRSDGATVLITTTADASGVAEYNLEGKYLTKSGEYRVSVKSSKDSLAGPFTKFEVFPQDVDLSKVSFETDKGVIASNGKDKASISIGVFDKYLNPIPYHQLQLFSQRKSDFVSVVGNNNYSNELGIVDFELSSIEPGMTSLYVYDSTMGKMIAENIGLEVSGDSSLVAFGGDDELVYTLSEDGLKYIFPNFPAQVKAGEPFNFTLEVQDSNNQKDLFYDGSVHFSVPGAQIGDVILPVDYTFKNTDQGSHVFSLSLQFQKEGTYKLVAQDVDNPDMLTEQLVVVGSGESSSLFHGASDGKIEITEPKSGTYSVASQVIQGKSSPGLAVKIYDNDKEIASVNTDIQGKFSYTTPALYEGKHTLYAVSVSNSGEILSVSDDVNVVIDVSGPTVKNVTVSPASGANPGQDVNIEFVAEEALSQVVIKFQGDTTEMQPVDGKANTYKAVVKAPQEFGSYALSLMLVDSLGNQTENEAVAQIVVGDESGEFVAQIPRIEAYPSNSRVTLMWEKPQSARPITNYRIYYGESPDVLNQVVDTSTDALTWYIPKLANGREFFFSMTAIDEKGNEGSQKSAIVSSIPFQTQTQEPQKPVDQQPVDDGVIASSPVVQGETGPGVIWLLLASILGGNFIIKRKNKLV